MLIRPDTFGHIITPNLHLYLEGTAIIKAQDCADVSTVLHYKLYCGRTYEHYPFMTLLFSLGSWELGVALVYLTTGVNE